MPSAQALFQPEPSLVAEAAEGHTHEGDVGLEDIRLVAEQHVGHHGPSPAAELGITIVAADPADTSKWGAQH